MTSPECSIWLYGSHARGDMDALSDLDIFIASDKYISEDILEYLVPGLPNESSISLYSWNEITKMAEYGSLFLHHLKSEGRLLWESGSHRGVLSCILSHLGNYQYAERDLIGFTTVLGDVRESLKGDGAAAYELAVLGTVLRHSSILGCWLLEAPCFGRVKPVERLITAYRLNPKIASEFPQLYDFRLYVDGRIDETQILEWCDPEIWVDRVEEVVKAIESRIHDYH